MCAAVAAGRAIVAHQALGQAAGDPTLPSPRPRHHPSAPAAAGARLITRLLARAHGALRAPPRAQEPRAASHGDSVRLLTHNHRLRSLPQHDIGGSQANLRPHTPHPRRIPYPFPILSSYVARGPLGGLKWARSRSRARDRDLVWMRDLGRSRGSLRCRMRWWPRRARARNGRRRNINFSDYLSSFASYPVDLIYSRRFF